MSLSDILDRLLKLEQLDDKPFDDLIERLKQVRELYADVKFANRQEIGIVAKDLTQSISAYKREIDDLKVLLERNIYENQEQFIAESEKFYQLNINKMTFDEYVDWNKRWTLSNGDFTHLSKRVANHCHWQQPALVFGANEHDILDAMIAADPLYVLERYPEYPLLQKKKLADLSARKIRFYTMDELKLLPENGFSVIAVLNQFSFLPWTQISELISRFNHCLAPGGHLIFNYNNCRTVKGFRFFEQRLAAFSVPSMYIDHCDSIGMKLMHSYDSPNDPFSFMEFAKPGKLSLIKKHPSVGIVKQQPTASNKAASDIRVRKLIHIFKS